MDSRTGISPSELGVQLLQNCLAELLSRFPQLDGAFAALSYTPDETMDGVGTDGDTIRFLPRVLLRRYLDDPAVLRRGYLHMLLHCLYLHPFAGRTGRRWDLAADMAVEQIIARSGLALPQDLVREQCLQGLDECSAEVLYAMLEQGAFPFSEEELEAAFRFDVHTLWRQDPEKRAKWRSLGAGAGRGGARAGRTAGTGTESVTISAPGRYDYRHFLYRQPPRRRWGWSPIP